jgi:hypothetical protein
MGKLILTLVVCLALGSAYAFGCGVPGEPSNCGNEVAEVSTRTERIVAEFEMEVRDGRLKQRTNIALNGIVRLAIRKLKAKGHSYEAKKLQEEWETRWDGYIFRVGRDLGDHRPLSQWLAEKYAMLELILGTTVMEATRLVDLKIINYGIPVVFSCVDNVDEAEFGRHFIPFSGTVIYWTSFVACVGGTWGTGFLFCSPISWGCEMLTENVLAPKLNPTVWRWSCQ